MDLKQNRMPVCFGKDKTFALDQEGNDIQKLHLALYIVSQITKDFKFFS